MKAKIFVSSEINEPLEVESSSLTIECVSMTGQRRKIVVSEHVAGDTEKPLGSWIELQIFADDNLKPFIKA